MAMDKQARLVNEHLEKIDQRLEKIEVALAQLIALLTAEAEAKPVKGKGIGETKS